jgi:hypothetical protein
MGVLHDRHLDPGVTIDSSAGNLAMQTFRKLPMASPNSNTSQIAAVIGD